jgi:hypothetical protein
MAVSPLRVGDEVELLGMAPEDECLHDMLVIVRWSALGPERTFGVRLAQLALVDADEIACQAVEDWRYWVDRGYIL